MNSANTQKRITPPMSPQFARQLRNLMIGGLMTMVTIAILLTYLLPFGNMATRSLKDNNPDVISLLPKSVKKLHYEGIFSYDGKEYPTENVRARDRELPIGVDFDIYNVSIDGEMRQLALAEDKRNWSLFLDPENPDGEPIYWEGSWRTLEPVVAITPRWENYREAWDLIHFPRLFRNTMVIAIVGMIGTLISSVIVAYGFARFPIPGKNILFIILISTIILPAQVTLVPTFAFFAKIGWTGTWLPLIVPHFFANAYNVFLLRQFFMTLPRELDEAAMIDGANPLQILLRIIIPLSWPAIVTVGLFHFVFAWNDFFNPLIYLLDKPKLQPISVGVQAFNFRFSTHPEYVQATSLMAMVVPLVIFFLLQRVFMRGIVITGVEK